MRFLCISIIVTVLASCEFEGVREKEKTKEITENFNKDTAKPIVIDSAFLVKDDGFAPERIDYDTAFNFCKRKAVSSVKTASGIQVEILQTENGEKIKKGDVVSLIYRGKLENGKVIETTEAFNKPMPYYVGLKMTLDEIDNVITICKIGDRVRFIIPADKAYGKQGHGALIPPNSNLVYEMHMVGPTRYIEPEKGIRLYSLISKPLARQVEATSTITLGYMGWTEKGKLFDATVFRKKDAILEVGASNTIKGWKHALVQMREGEKTLVFIPSSMGYGANGVPEMVPPNSNLIYILEVKQIN